MRKSECGSRSAEVGSWEAEVSAKGKAHSVMKDVGGLRTDEVGMIRLRILDFGIRIERAKGNNDS